MTKIKAIYICLLMLVVCLFNSNIGTLSYVHDTTTMMSNHFLAVSNIGIQIQEDFNGTLKEDVGVYNAGDAVVYVRMQIILQVVDEEGNVMSDSTFYDEEGNVLDISVQLDEVLMMKFNSEKTYNEEDWMFINGSYYYKYQLEADSETSYVYNKIRQRTTYYLYDENMEMNTYQIKVTLFAQSIEVAGISVWSDDVVVLEDSTLSSVGGD